MTEIRLYNTATRRKEPLEPTVVPGKVGMYVCGPTVYDRAHIGNARPVVVFDVLFRLLRHRYGAENVTYVRNITDVDDKINARAAATRAPGESELQAIARITAETTRWFHEDMDALAALRPTHEPRATEYIGQMVAMIATLIARGHAYAAEGHVLFSVSSYPEYGRLARRSLDEMRAGARVEVAPYKRDPMDFVLWKPSDADTPGWDSPWGRGRPGWHIECSAMAHDLLGASFDIHGGGIDLAFPHHENEVAQSRCAHPEGRFARIWMHNGFLNVEGEKMSKSLGNFFTVRDLLDEYERDFGISNFGPAIRLRLIAGHYRSPIDASRSFLEEAAAKLDTYRHFLRGWTKPTDPEAFRVAVDASGVIEALSDDLNTPEALRILDGLVSEVKRQTVAPDAQGATPLMPSSWSEFPTVLDKLGCALEFLGFSLSDLSNFDANARADALRAQILTTNVGGRIEELLRAREDARVSRDFARADAIRDGLAAAGVRVKDQRGEASSWELGPDFDPSKLEALT
jgi:cysteinyl-tRNA synthetase